MVVLVVDTDNHRISIFLVLTKVTFLQSATEKEIGKVFSEADSILLFHNFCIPNWTKNTFLARASFCQISSLPLQVPLLINIGTNVMKILKMLDHFQVGPITCKSPAFFPFLINDDNFGVLSDEQKTFVKQPSMILKLLIIRGLHSTESLRRQHRTSVIFT